MSDNFVVDAAVQRKRGPRAESPMPVIREAKPGVTVTARVLKKGDGKLSTGEHIPGEGDVFHVLGDILQVPAEAVEALEDRGYVEAQ